MKYIKLLIITAMVVSLFWGCSKDEEADIFINSLIATPNSIYPDSMSTVVASVDYSGDKTKTYTWTADEGEITGTGSQITWKAPSETGTYTIELTVGDGDVTDEASVQVSVTETPIMVFSGTITGNTTLTPDREYLLRGGVFVGDGTNETVLTIEPGVTIYGESSTWGVLVVRRNSKIMAEGTAAAPIVMTSDKPVGSRGRSDWGGLIINGNAPLNTGDEAYGEGGTGYYGGDDPHDNSGVLKYVRVEYAGREISPDNELNGIAFQGVGDETEVDYVQVHMNKDDGIEFFGGTCNIKHVVLTGIADDCFDYTDGWTGKAQFIVAQQYGDDADQGFECDNNGEDNTATPYSNPTIYNFTMIGAPDGPESDIGALIREGTKGKWYNGIIMGFGEYGLDIDHDQTFLNVDDGSLIFDNVLFYDNAATFSNDDDGFDEENFAMTTMTNNAIVTQGPVVDPFDLVNPDFRPQNAALTHAYHNPPNDGFFEDVDYIGGVDPDDDWTAGWIITDAN
ncbi:PKD domain-containing protein [bacterium]|nr:PKD domain-containing protein [bacterium]